MVCVWKGGEVLRRGPGGQGKNQGSYMSSQPTEKACGTVPGEALPNDKEIPQFVKRNFYASAQKPMGGKVIGIIMSRTKTRTHKLNPIDGGLV